MMMVQNNAYLNMYGECFGKNTFLILRLFCSDYPARQYRSQCGIAELHGSSQGDGGESHQNVYK